MVLIKRDVCLLRHLGNPKLCEPTSSAYIALHGLSGNGGRLGDSAIPVDYQGMLLADVVHDAPIMRRMNGYAKSFVKQFEDEQQRLLDEGKTVDEIRLKSLYLWSEAPGTGKTTLACALLQEYLVENFIGHVKRGLTPPLRPVYYLDVNDWQTTYNEFNREKVPEDVAELAARKYYRALEKAKTTELVVLDDLGVRKATEGFRGDLHAIVNHRVSNKMPTIYTSNIPIEEQEEIFGEQRLMSRLTHMTMPIEITGETRRGMNV